MAIVIGAALAVLSAVVVLYPFFKSRFGRRADGGGRTAPPASADAQPIYDAIRTLQLEYQLGNVPEEQYREQLLDYRLQAAQALWEQDQRLDESEELEAEIRAARASLYGYSSGKGADSDDAFPAGNGRADVQDGNHPTESSDTATPGGPDQ